MGACDPNIDPGSASPQLETPVPQTLSLVSCEWSPTAGSVPCAQPVFVGQASRAEATV